MRKKEERRRRRRHMFVCTHRVCCVSSTRQCEYLLSSCVHVNGVVGIHLDTTQNPPILYIGEWVLYFINFSNMITGRRGKRECGRGSVGERERERERERCYIGTYTCIYIYAYIICPIFPYILIYVSISIVLRLQGEYVHWI
jgi:hypothetical protein